MTELEQKVLDAAREWLVDRVPCDDAEKALAAAVARTWPNNLACREDCTCGEVAECDECPTSAQLEALIAQWEYASMREFRFVSTRTSYKSHWLPLSKGKLPRPSARTREQLGPGYNLQLRP